MTPALQWFHLNFGAGHFSDRRPGTSTLRMLLRLTAVNAIPRFNLASISIVASSPVPRVQSLSAGSFPEQRIRFSCIFMYTNTPCIASYTPFSFVREQLRLFVPISQGYSRDTSEGHSLKAKEKIKQVLPRLQTQVTIELSWKTNVNEYNWSMHRPHHHCHLWRYKRMN